MGLLSKIWALLSRLLFGGEGGDGRKPPVGTDAPQTRSASPSPDERKLRLPDESSALVAAGDSGENKATPGNPPNMGAEPARVEAVAEYDSDSPNQGGEESGAGMSGKVAVSEAESSDGPEDALVANDDLPPSNRTDSGEPAPPEDSNREGKRNDGKGRPRKNRGKRVRDRGDKTSSGDKRDPVSVPRLVCFHGGQGWTVAVEFPAAADGVSACFSDGRPLSRDSNGLWIADSLSEGGVLARWDGVEKSFPLSPPLIFRTRNGWKGRGVRQGGMTGGYYIALAPESWKRKREEWNPLWSRYGGMRAHEFEILRDEDAMGDGFRESDVFRFRGRFRLEGKPSFDDERGTIFMGGPPCVVDRENWAGVKWVQTGLEESAGRDARLELSQPKPDASPLEIRSDDVGGWFFVRIYDGDVELIHNPHFRFLRALRDIRIESSVLPLTGGHRDMVVEVVGEGVAVESRQSRGRIRIEGQRVIVRPRPGGENVLLSLCADGAKIEAEFADPRVWWALARPGDGLKWTDKPLKISSEKFHAVKTLAELRFKLPGAGIVEAVEAGFSPLADPVRGRVTRNQAESAIPLRSLGNARGGAMICARFPGVEDGREIPVLRIVASPSPSPSSPRRRMSGVVVGRASGIAQVRIKRGTGRRGSRKIQARDERSRCRKGDRVVVEKLPRHPKAWRVV